MLMNKSKIIERNWKVESLKKYIRYLREAKVNIDQNINYVRNMNVDQKINFGQNLIYDQKIYFDKNIYCDWNIEI